MTRPKNRAGRIAHTMPTVIETSPWFVGPRRHHLCVTVKGRLAVVDVGRIDGPGELLVVKEYLNPVTGEWDRQPGGDPCELIVDAVIAASDARIMAEVRSAEASKNDPRPVSKRHTDAEEAVAAVERRERLDR